MKILITGSNGLLGQKIVAECLANNIDFIATSKGENRNPDCPSNKYKALDITHNSNIREIFEATNPSHIIHTAAITNVDYCELNQEECDKVNVRATEYLVENANLIKAHFQFISTDFVFDGEKGDYSENDQINPLGYYAVSKVKGEEIVQRLCSSSWSIVRTIIVYGKGNNLSRTNLILWAKGALEKSDTINIIDDQFRAPTYAQDLALGCLAILESRKDGIFHLSGPETMSVYEIVNRIAKHFGYSMDKVSRISSATLDQPAKRPPKTGFNLMKAKTEIAYKARTLEESLDLMY